MWWTRHSWGWYPAQALARGPAHQRNEPHLLGGIIAEQAGELARHRLGTRLFDAPQRHAGVLGLEHDRDAARLEHLVDRGDDLRVEMLLGLHATRIDADEAGVVREGKH